MKLIIDVGPKLTIDVGPFKKAVNLSVAALKGQIDLLHAMGYSSQRPVFIERLKAEAAHLSDLIEEAEAALIASIEHFFEEVIDQSAETRDVLVEFGKKTGNSEIRERAGTVRKDHERRVTSLGKSELDAIRELREHMALMKDAVSKLLCQIENLRIR